MKVFLIIWSYFYVTNTIAATFEKIDKKTEFERTRDQSNSRFKRAKCTLSHTKVNGRAACQGELIFSDYFKSDGINSDWSHEIIIPSDPNYEFVVFDNNVLTSSAGGGLLHFRLSSFEDAFIRNGRLELSRCTGRLYTDECVKNAKGFSILPPVQSARITTKNSFSFKYGKVQVRAKLPVGDWIIPEIWLEPKRRVYGPSYLSGRVRIAAARGNKDLVSAGGDKIGINELQSNIIMGTSDRILGRTTFRERPEGWYKQFHNFTLIWEQDNISFMVDGEEREYVINKGEKLSKEIGFDDDQAINWQYGNSIAPFDQEFYISLGLAVGGMKDFPDECVSGGHPKPWRNLAVKAMLYFWEDRDHWRRTWNDQESQLQIEHVTVHAL